MRDALLGSGWRTASFTRISVPILHYFRLQQAIMRLRGVAASTSSMNFMIRALEFWVDASNLAGLHLAGGILIARKSMEIMT